MLDLAASEKDVHADFYNGSSLISFLPSKMPHKLFNPLSDFEDLYDEDDL